MASGSGSATTESMGSMAMTVTVTATAIMAGGDGKDRRQLGGSVGGKVVTESVEPATKSATMTIGHVHAIGR